MASPAGPTGDSSDDSLRWTFVEMLFALAVSQVAVHLSDLIALPISVPWRDRMPAFAHLGVSFGLIATSWLGWRLSRAPGSLKTLKFVFSLRFLALLSDVLLVVVYFIIVRSVEIEQKGGETTLAVVSARPESIGLCVVFGVYALWDLATDVFSPGSIPSTDGRLWMGFKAAFVSSLASIVCLVLSFVTSVHSATRHCCPVKARRTSGN